MWNNLHDFYISTEWRKFRQALIAERINKTDGILYDEYSGKPIVESYDIILHHKKELTLQNVNDYDVSLNPENIMIVSLKSHNEIHERFGIVIRNVYYVHGSPCSGKSTFVRNSKGANDIVVDIDLLWQAVTGGEKYFKPDALKSNVFILRDALLDQIKTRAGKWSSAYIITTEPRRAARERVISALGAKEIYIPTTKEVALSRLVEDSERTNHVNEWTEYIERWFETADIPEEEKTA